MTNWTGDQDGVAGVNSLCKDGSKIVVGSNLASMPVGLLAPGGTMASATSVGTRGDPAPVKLVEIIDISNDKEEDAMIKPKKNCSLAQ